jgi:hypothetical protein
MDRFRIIYRSLTDNSTITIEEMWADTLTEVYAEVKTHSGAAGEIRQLVNGKWVEKLGFVIP